MSEISKFDSDALKKPNTPKKTKAELQKQFDDLFMDYCRDAKKIERAYHAHRLMCTCLTGHEIVKPFAETDHEKDVRNACILIWRYAIRILESALNDDVPKNRQTNPMQTETMHNECRQDR